jgi:hypothetical protein
MATTLKTTTLTRRFQQDARPLRDQDPWRQLWLPLFSPLAMCSQTRNMQGGVHQAERDGKTHFTAEEIKLLKSQDLNYVNLKRVQEVKK